MGIIVTLIVVAVIVGVLAVGYYLLKPWVGGSNSAAQIPSAPAVWEPSTHRFEVPNAAQKFEDEAVVDYGHLKSGVNQATAYVRGAEEKAIEEFGRVKAEVKTEVAKVKTKAKKVAATAKADVTKVKTAAAKIRRKTA